MLPRQKGGRPETPDKESKAIEARRLKDQGAGYRDIAKALGVSRGTVANLLTED